MAIASRRYPRLAIAVLLALALHPAIGAQNPRDLLAPLPTAAPASVGFNEERLARLDARMKRFVDEGQHAGIVMLLARKGRIVDSPADAPQASSNRAIGALRCSQSRCSCSRRFRPWW